MPCTNEGLENPNTKNQCKTQLQNVRGVKMFISNRLASAQK